MINKTQKMYKSNSKARKWLIENGFKDIHLFPHTRWSKDVHFRDLEFDGIAAKGKKLVLFQVKSNHKQTKEMQQKYKEVSEESGILCLWINCPDRKEIEVLNDTL